MMSSVPSQSSVHMMSHVPSSSQGKEKVQQFRATAIAPHTSPLILPTNTTNPTPFSLQSSEPLHRWGDTGI